jgi:hypothetical protein
MCHGLRRLKPRPWHVLEQCRKNQIQCSDNPLEHKKTIISFDITVSILIIWGLFTFPHVIAVSSTAVGLTSLFEMGRGEHYSYQPHKVFSVNSYQ